MMNLHPMHDDGDGPAAILLALLASVALSAILIGGYLYR